jgi:hypothetical protein
MWRSTRQTHPLACRCEALHAFIVMALHIAIESCGGVPGAGQEVHVAIQTKGTSVSCNRLGTTHAAASLSVRNHYLQDVYPALDKLLTGCWTQKKMAMEQ